MIRSADKQDIPAILDLLSQVLAVHHAARPDLFAPAGTKYSAAELEKIISDSDSPVFVYEDGGSILGYIFCRIEHHSEINEIPHKTLYVDDLCVDANARGKHVGTHLYHFAKEFARKEGCYNLTLHVWEGNDGAKAFYESMGMKPQYTSLETIL